VVEEAQDAGGRRSAVSLKAHRLLITSGLWSVILRLAGMVVSFALGVLLARYLAPAGYGIFGVAMAIVALLSSAAQLGLPMLATRELSVSRARGDLTRLRGVLRWFGLAVTAAALVLAALFILAVVLAPGAATEFKITSLWAAAMVPLMALLVLVSAELRAFDRLVAGQSLEILVRPAAVTLLLLGWFAWYGAMSPAAAMALSVGGTALTLLLGFWWLRREVPAAARSARPEAHPREWARAGAPLAVTDLMRQFDGTYAVLVMGMFATAAQTGVFRVAHSSLGVIAIPLSVIHVVLAPTLARLHAQNERERLEHLLAISAAAMFGGALAMFLAVILAGKWLIVTLFGADYSGAWMALVILTAAQVINGFFGLTGVMLAMGHAEKQQLRAFATANLLSVAAAVPLAILWGGVGVALAALAGAVINGAMGRHYAKRELGVETSVLALAGLRSARRRRPLDGSL
jgi:O-antigen/teichoic acid export membrane protein